MFVADFGLTGHDGRLYYSVYEGWGNHDQHPGPASPVTEGVKARNRVRPGVIHVSANGHHYSWDWDGVHFVMLNEYPGTGTGDAASWGAPLDSLPFLVSDLETHVGESGRGVVLFIHVAFDGWGLANWAGWEQDANTCDPLSRLEFGKTYYWRVDEVNAAPDGAVFKGGVWSFTVEPVSYPLAREHVTATASSSRNTDVGPEKTIDGSGLDPNDGHSTDVKTMWLSSTTGEQPTWIQYTFDQAYRLHQLWVWNSNQDVEPDFGIGFSPDEFFPMGNDGNGSGALVGYDPLTGPIMETTIVHEGKQSMPLTHDNTKATYSEAKRTFASSQDWTRYGIKSLRLWFYGDPANVAQQMYVKINGAKIPYIGAPEGAQP